MSRLNRATAVVFVLSIITSLLISAEAAAGLATQQCLNDCPWDDRDASIAAYDDDVIFYELPFTFPYFGRSIVALSVNTNGLIELLEAGESCVECDDFCTHHEGAHVSGNIDAIFAANDDLITGVLIEGESNFVEVMWIGVTYQDGDFSFTVDEMLFKVILYDDGEIDWKFFDLDWSDYDCTLFSGLYDEVGDLLLEIPGSTTSYTGEHVEVAFKYDPDNPGVITSMPWTPLDLSVTTHDDDNATYTLPFTFPFFGRDIVEISVNTNGLIELLEAGESCDECTDYCTFADGEHVNFEIDAIFALNGDLITGTIIEGFPDGVEISWIGTDYRLDADSFDDEQLGFKVILLPNGVIKWKVFDRLVSATECGEIIGLYDAEGGQFVGTPGFQVPVGDGVNVAWEYDPQAELGDCSVCASGLIASSGFADILSDFFFIIDLETGAATPIGRVGTDAGAVVDLAIDPSTGIIYGAETTSDPQYLYTIDPATGMGTQLPQPTGGSYLSIVFDGTGTLFGAGFDEENIFVLDPATGDTIENRIGTPQVIDDVSGMAYGPDGMLYASASTSQNALLVIDPATGDQVSQTPFTDPEGARKVTDVAFGPDGTLYGVAKESGSDTVSDLVVIDPVTATFLKTVGSTGYNLAGLGEHYDGSCEDDCSPGSTVAQDDCENAQCICPGFLYTDDTTGATNDAIVFCGLIFGGLYDVWYSYTPAESGLAAVSVCNGLQAVVSVHSGCPGSEANKIACNYASAVGTNCGTIWNVSAGQTYLIRVAGFNNSVGPFELMLVGPPCVEQVADAGGPAMPPPLMSLTQAMKGGCPADLDDNGLVDPADFELLLQAFGECAQTPCTGDLNGDDVVDQLDAAIVLSQIGICNDGRRRVVNPWSWGE